MTMAGASTRIAIIVSSIDPAGQNVKANLLEMREWQFLGKKATESIWQHKNYIMIEIEEYHTYADGIDRKIEQAPELMIFASMHKAKVPRPIITAHFTGNIGEAAHGGRSREIATPAPYALKPVLSMLKSMASGTEFEVTMEGTHHGPSDLQTPSLYVEIGSSEKEWQNKVIGKMLATAIITFTPEKNKPVAVSFGGTHYAPRQTQLLFETDVAFAHVIPEHSLKDLDAEMLKMVFEKSKPDFAHLDRKSISAEKRKWLEENIQKLGYQILRESEIRERWPLRSKL